MNNYSRQREVILDVVKNIRIHPTAEEIYNLVIQEEPKISRSTVYRNINILVEQGAIRKIKMTIGPDRYDYLHKEHYHVVCKVCGKVLDFYYDFEKENIMESIKQQTNIDIDVNSITICGICENCKSKIKNKEELENGIKRK